MLTAQTNAELLAEQALAFQPNAVVIADESRYEWLKDRLASTCIKVYAGARALEEVVAMEGVDIVLTALVGFAGLKPTLAAIKAGKTIALANKETLVAAGELVQQAALADPRLSSHRLERELAALALENHECSLEQYLTSDLSGVVTHG